MTQYREILRLHSQGISQRNIAVSCGCSRNTVVSTIGRASEHGLVWPPPSEMTDAKLQKSLHSGASVEGSHKMPDYEYIHREMGKAASP